jgi:hypothetical protein
MEENAGCAFVVEYAKMNEVLTKETEKMVGEILTIIEASMPDGSSREATKSLVKQSVWRSVDRMKEKINPQKK